MSDTKALSPIERFEEMYIPEPNSGCWLWIGRSLKGYGRFGGSHYAHRLSFQLFNGPIPKGMWVCHRCDTPFCVNPQHLFAAPPRGNVMDCVAKGRHRNQHDGQELCQNGHPLSGDNLKIESGKYRRCRTCQRAYQSTWRKNKNGN